MSFNRFTIQVRDYEDPETIKVATMLAPNCTLEDAKLDAVLRFGADRVVDVSIEGESS